MHTIIKKTQPSLSLLTFILIVIFFFWKCLQVEFPEARIFEETLNVLLYENRTGPDDDLMQATRKGTVTGHGYHSDDDADEKLDREVRMRRK